MKTQRLHAPHPHLKPGAKDRTEAGADPHVPSEIEQLYQQRKRIHLRLIACCLLGVTVLFASQWV